LSKWLKFEGEYERYYFYDLKLFDGRIALHCEPYGVNLFNDGHGSLYWVNHIAFFRRSAQQ
jgi:hypothetical protein